MVKGASTVHRDGLGRPSYGFESDRRTWLRFFVESGLTRRFRVRSRDSGFGCLCFRDGEHLVGLVGALFGSGAASKVGAGSKVGANGSGAVAVRSGAAVGSRAVREPDIHGGRESVAQILSVH